MSGSWSANPTSQRKLVTAIIEYLTAGIAVSLRKNFSMTLHSATPGPAALNYCNAIYNLLQCEMANCIAALTPADNAQA